MAGAYGVDLPRKVEETVEAMQAKGYVVDRSGKQQLQISYRGQKVGGWNTRDEHWYVSKVIARGHCALLKRHGFRWREKPDHQWWQIDGVEGACGFVAVASELTGVRIP